ncbi:MULTISPECIES: cell division protein FtsA [Idiomarina]|jgi:cell division protein FtsA|uniref:Cell division protein FtsA n=3 Tax=Idiomarina baltica TaxID=190892 RepID=A0A348WKT8_9GAMM|nr:MULTISPECIES: cell division protein FtsA [Idiomarina]MEC8926060.1 cell division protein FtsA [Pseudomonadota bacterium]HAR55150.1 cell division protein FtsA [Idiomarina baltica]EAQ31613.1 Cell division ATPase, FtsA [Idiomarina baltica OS145]KXS36526.1 MAG: cell division ATPase, FtsA [Idiomarina sp. T82-3]MBR36929.1 cell division protein FtsA [Idiomarina sp.]
MSKTTERQMVVGLDIGTSKVTALVGELLPDDDISVIGVGVTTARGMDKGGVNDLNLVVQSIQRAVDEAELMADCRIASVYLNISGRHISCQNESGMVPVNEAEVTQDDVDNVIHAAQSVPIAKERRILHVLPQEYVIDSQESIRSPIGMSGVRMESKVHIITCANDMAKNITKAVERCGLQVDKLIFSALASSISVLTDDEKDLGVALVDMGGGTIDICIYAGGVLRHTAVIPAAGNQVTSDIAKIFRTPTNHAEQIKTEHACALRGLVSMEDTIEVPSVGGRPARMMSRHTLAEVVEPRYQELFELVREEIVQSGLDEQVAAGVVLTGGSAKMQGCIEFAEEIFQMPVRIGKPLHIKGLKDYVEDPVYATAVGLLKYGQEDATASQQESSKTDVIGMWQKLQNWFKGEF